MCRRVCHRQSAGAFMGGTGHGCGANRRNRCRDIRATYCPLESCGLHAWQFLHRCGRQRLWHDHCLHRAQQFHLCRFTSDVVHRDSGWVGECCRPDSGSTDRSCSARKTSVHPGIPVPALRRSGDSNLALPPRWSLAPQDANFLLQGDVTMSSSTIVQVRDLTMRFGGLTALDRLNMDIREGEVLGLLGPNGSGKTTFFNVLTGLYRASEGSILYDGQEVLGMTPQLVYRSGVARTFQRSRLSLPLTVFDNIAIGDYQHMQHGLIFNLLRRKAFRAEYM